MRFRNMMCVLAAVLAAAVSVKGNAKGAKIKALESKTRAQAVKTQSKKQVSTRMASGHGKGERSAGDAGGLLEVEGSILAHDPVIVKENGLYWRFDTGAGIQVSSSDDLLYWSSEGRAFDENPAWTAETVPGSTDFWAPDVVKRGDEWRLYYSVSTFGSNCSAIALATAKSLEDASINGWEDKGCVISSDMGDDYNCIDPQAFVCQSGGDNLLFGSFWDGIFAVPLGADGKIKEGDIPELIASRQAAPNAIEGGYIFCHKTEAASNPKGRTAGDYYLFASHDFCCRGASSTYHIVAGKSLEGAYGPYRDKNGADMLVGGGTTLRDGKSSKRWAGPGHCSIFHDDDGTDYIVYHAYDRQDNGAAKLQIEKITWKDGWPVLGEDREIER